MIYSIAEISNILAISLRLDFTSQRLVLYVRNIVEHCTSGYTPPKFLSYIHINLPILPVYRIMHLMSRKKMKDRTIFPQSYRAMHVST
jgi:hypothetical protein